MSENTNEVSVDVVAEMRGFADALESVAPLVETPANLRRWADHMERLQAEVARLQKFEVQHLIRYGGGTFIPNKQTGDSK